MKNSLQDHILYCIRNGTTRVSIPTISGKTDICIQDMRRALRLATTKASYAEHVAMARKFSCAADYSKAKKSPKYYVRVSRIHQLFPEKNFARDCGWVK